MICPSKKNMKKIISIVLLLSIVIFTAYYFRTPIFSYIYRDYKAPTPDVHNEWEGKSEPITQGDFYVSKNGSDTNDGTWEKPFLTIERALKAVEYADRTGKSEIVVCIEEGTYSINSLDLSGEHGGNEECRVVYSSYGDGKVVLNAGMNIDSDDFVGAREYPEIYQRLSEAARDNVYIVDLTKAPYEMEQEDWGKLYPIGTYNTAGRYSGDTTGPMYSELFVNGIRQNLARYPNKGYIYTDSVITSGKDTEDESGTDPAGDVFSVNDELASRIRSWGSLENVWMYGFWQYDWADGSTPIDSFDAVNNSLTTKYQSFFGVRENAPYYFYNCLEELDTDNEWYLDRENGLMCVYSSGGLENDEIEMSLSTAAAITINASFITINNLTVVGTRGNGIVVNGNDNVIRGCTVADIGGNAIQVSGSNNLITRNEITNTGKGGISAIGGDSPTLSPGNNVISNNLVHDWSQIYKTYQAGIALGGVGNICANNELYNSPHLGITYSGNNHVIEYNLLHDVCLESSDSGTIYAGKSWSSYGNEIRYNLIYNVGSSEYASDGIYMDDAISGQSIYGNVLINIPKHAIFIGGGRDMKVYDNLIINAGESAIRYDARARDALLFETWFSGDVEGLWRTLRASPWKSEIWQNAFPQYKTISDDIADIDDPRFMANPAGSVIKNNIVFDKTASLGSVDNAVYSYSTVSENSTYYIFLLSSAFPSFQRGSYHADKSSPIDLMRFNEVLEKAGIY